MKCIFKRIRPSEFAWERSAERKVMGAEVELKLALVCPVHIVNAVTAATTTTAALAFHARVVSVLKRRLRLHSLLQRLQASLNDEMKEN